MREGISPGRGNRRDCSDITDYIHGKPTLLLVQTEEERRRGRKEGKREGLEGQKRGEVEVGIIKIILT